MSPKKTLDCQDCGADLYELTPDQIQEVARDPYRFIVYCGSCRRARQ
jgi:hypothetical protein